MDWMPARKISATYAPDGRDERVDALARDDRQCEVDQEDLHEEWRAAEEVDVDCREDAQELDARDARDADEETDDHAECHRESRNLDRDASTHEQEREGIHDQIEVKMHLLSPYHWDS
jgi:hypothetical protein